jgi:hypothetical protein
MLCMYRNLPSTIRTTHIFTAIPSRFCCKTSSTGSAPSAPEDTTPNLTLRYPTAPFRLNLASRLNLGFLSPSEKRSSVEKTVKRSHPLLYVCAAASRKNASRQHDQLWTGYRGEHHNKAITMRKTQDTRTNIPPVHTRSPVSSIVHPHA